MEEHCSLSFEDNVRKICLDPTDDISQWPENYRKVVETDLDSLRAKHPFNADAIAEMRQHTTLAGVGDGHLYESLEDILGWIGEARGRLNRIEQAVWQFRDDLRDYGAKSLSRSLPVMARPQQAEHCGIDEYWPS